MRLRTDMDHLPMPIRQELHRIKVMLFESFDETTRGRLSEQYRAGRILSLILHGPYAEQDWADVEPGEAFRLLVIVNYPRLARNERDWRLVRDRLRRAWENGEITRPVRLAVASLDQINRALIDGVPHSVMIAETGIALYRMEGMRLQAPRHLPVRERAARGLAECERWHQRGREFLIGAGFYRDRGNAPMAALMLHQACEHFYLCVLWSLTLHGPRTHALDELREAAEALDKCLAAAWPRSTPFERRAFGCIRRAYIEARYGRSYRISQHELSWAFTRVVTLQEQALWACARHLASLAPALSISSTPAIQAITPRLHAPISLPSRMRPTTPRPSTSRARWNRLIREHQFWRTHGFRLWLDRISISMLGICIFLAGAQVAIWRVQPALAAQTIRDEPAAPSAVLDFDVRADTVLGAVGAIAERAGYKVKANDDIWTMRWTGSYRARATTFDALSDILYGSGLCPGIRDDTITVRYCGRSRLPVAAVRAQMRRQAF